jgi:hypothetical protein
VKDVIGRESDAATAARFHDSRYPRVSLQAYRLSTTHGAIVPACGYRHIKNAFCPVAVATIGTVAPCVASEAQANGTRG